MLSKNLKYSKGIKQALFKLYLFYSKDKTDQSNFVNEVLRGEKLKSSAVNKVTTAQFQLISNARGSDAEFNKFLETCSNEFKIYFKYLLSIEKLNEKGKFFESTALKKRSIKEFPDLESEVVKFFESSYRSAVIRFKKNIESHIKNNEISEAKSILSSLQLDLTAEFDIYEEDIESAAGLQIAKNSELLDIKNDLKKINLKSKFEPQINSIILDRLKVALNTDEISDDQGMTLITDVKHQIVSARAGSGKTTTVINKIKLLYNLNKIHKDEFLFLAFNKDVRNDVSNDLAKDLKKNPKEIRSKNVHTFHSFAQQVAIERIGEADVVKDYEQEEFYKKIYLNAFDDEVFSSLFFEYLSSITSPNIDTLERYDRAAYTSDEDYFRARSEAHLLTLDNIAVKSLGEKLIGDFFFEHDQKYTYEPSIYLYEENVVYRPDFTLNFLADAQGRKIYIENWGIYNPISGVNDSHTAPFDLETYKKERLQKLTYWNQKTDQILLETFLDDIYGTVNYDEVKAKTFQQIKEDFYKLFHQKIFDLTGEHLKRLSQEEVIKKMENIFESKVLHALISYMQNVKNNRVDPDELNKKIKRYADDLSERSKIFLEMASLFRRKVHHEKMSAKVLEFADYIELAIQELERGNNLHLIKDLKYLFVDEFQDTNEGFLQLIKIILKINPCIQLIVVGDDWQSINSFMGAKVSIFNSFEEIFLPSERNFIITNFRSGKEIVDYGNTIMKDKGKAAKSFESRGVGRVSYIDIHSVFKDLKFEEVKSYNTFLDQEKNKYDDNFKLAKYNKFLTDKIFEIVKDQLNQKENSQNMSIYDFEKEIFLLCRTKEINNESVNTHLLRLIIMRVTKKLQKLGIKEGRKETEDNLKELIKFKTIHTVKGGQADIVFLLEANSRMFPLKHPDRELSAIFCDDPSQYEAIADEEERRLLYVASTRAKNHLYVISSPSDQSVFMPARSYTPLSNAQKN